MQIVFGGAFNGKRQFVKEKFRVDNFRWYEGELPPKTDEATVIAGLENWVEQQLLLKNPEANIMKQVQATCRQNGTSEQIWVLTDMNRGIVPTSALERELRDVIGRIYQFLFNEADDITRIWYGIPQTIKGADQDENLY